MDKHEKMRLLEKLITDSNEVISLDKSDKEFVAWRSRVGAVLGRIFGRNSLEVTKFRNLDFYSRETSMDDISEQKKSYIRDLAIAREDIQSYIDEVRGVMRENAPLIQEEEEEVIDTAEQEEEAIEVVTELEIIPEVTTSSDDSEEEKPIEIEENQEEIIINEEVKEEKEEPVIRREFNIFRNNSYDILVIGNTGDNINKTVSILEKLKLTPVVFNDFSKEIFEYNENYLGIKSVVILYDTPEEEKSKRDKLIFSIGKLLGKFGDDNVILINSEEMQVEEVFQNMKSIETDKRDRWFFDIAKELKSIGYRIDLNDLI